VSNQAALIIAVAVLVGAGLIAWSVHAGDLAEEADTESGRARDAAPSPRAGPGLAPAGSDARMARLEAQQRETQRKLDALLAGGDRPGAAEAGATEPDDGTAPGAAEPKRQARVLELVRAYATGTATPEQVRELLGHAKDRALMGRIVASLQSKIAADPDDVAARLQLAEVESARVHGAESITERAMLAKNVREQITAVLEREPENWDARYMQAVGISHSQRSPQGRAEAIRAFESLIGLQEKRSSEPRFAETYGQLSEVYLAEKDVDKARATLEAGLARHPGDKKLRERLDALNK
jgi:tetratricopeptide (TPR) repeat protein